MSRTKVIVTCDKCGKPIGSLGSSGWTVTIQESHSEWRGTMGYERAYTLDFCGPCGSEMSESILKSSPSKIPTET